MIMGRLCYSHAAMPNRHLQTGHSSLSAGFLGFEKKIYCLSRLSIVILDCIAIVAFKDDADDPFLIFNAYVLDPRFPLQIASTYAPVLTLTEATISKLPIRCHDILTRLDSALHD